LDKTLVCVKDYRLCICFYGFSIDFRIVSIGSVLFLFIGLLSNDIIK